MLDCLTSSLGSMISMAFNERRILTNTRYYGAFGISVPISAFVTLSSCHAFLARTLTGILVANLSHGSVRVAVTR